MQILVSNDDGILAPGIRALADTLSRAGHQVTVVCPDRERSATGHALTMDRPLRAERVANLFASGVSAWAVNGTPSDSVKLGLDALIEGRPQLVVSGINNGPNLGSDVLYSGTVSAAMEGAIEGLPSIAVSLASRIRCDFQPAADFIVRCAAALESRPLPEAFLININVPVEIAGVRLCRLGMRRYRDQFLRRVDPRGGEYFWLAGEVIEAADPPDSDVVAVAEGFISITPLKYDLTYQPGLVQLREWPVEKLWP